jgi:hypothetical protein
VVKSVEDAFDLASALGAAPGLATKKFTIYLPDKNRRGEPIPNHDDWVRACMETMAAVNQGATKMAPASGMWKDPDSQDPVIHETTHLVYSFLRDEEAFRDRIEEIRAFLHEFGSMTDQGEVMVEMFGEEEGGFYSRSYSIEPPYDV